MKLTDTNLFALTGLSAGREVFPNKIAPPSVPHIRRCMKLGLVEVIDRQTLKLTAYGMTLVTAELAARPHMYQRERALLAAAVAAAANPALVITEA